MKKILIILALTLVPLLGSSQELLVNENNDTLAVITIQQVRELNQVFKDLELTKEELRVSDSIIAHKDKQLKIQDSIITLKDSMIKEKKSSVIKTALFSTIIGFIIGVLL